MGQKSTEISEQNIVLQENKSPKVFVYFFSLQCQQRNSFLKFKGEKKFHLKVFTNKKDGKKYFTRKITQKIKYNLSLVYLIAVF